MKEEQQNKGVQNGYFQCAKMFWSNGNTKFQKYENYVPIDYIKGEIINGDLKYILNDSKLNFGQPVNIDTGEIIREHTRAGKVKKESRKAVFKNFVFKYIPDTNRMYFTGSLHNFYNNGLHNYNDFGIKAFKRTLNNFCLLLRISADQIHITSLEWGVNIVPPIPSNKIIDACLYFGSSIMANSLRSKTANYKEVIKNEFIFKVYNKALQYGISNRYILRIEHKQKDYNKYCRRFNIGQTMQDLINSGFIGFRSTLINNWNKILFYDPLLSEHCKYIKYRDPLFWENLRSKKSGRQLIHRKKNHLNLLNKSQGGNIQEKVSQLIETTLDHLNFDVLTFSQFTYRGRMLTSNSNR